MLLSGIELHPYLCDLLAADVAVNDTATRDRTDGMQGAVSTVAGGDLLSPASPA